MTAALLGAGVSVVLFSAALVIPLAGFVSGFLAAAPLSLVRLHADRTVALFATLLGGLILALTYTPLVAGWYMAQCGLAGYLVPELALSGHRPSRVILWSTASASLLTVLLVVIISLATGLNPQLFVEKEVGQGLEQAMKLYETPGKLSVQDIETLKSGMESIGQLMIRIYPALATLNLMLVCIITTGLFFYAAARRSVKLAAVPFSNFKAPELLVWPAILAGFATLIPYPLLTTPALNLLVVLGFVYFIQGFAVLLCLINKTDYRGMLKVFTVILLMTQPYLAMVVAIIGIFDIWGDFRALSKQTEENL